jgi:hypothetical protein
MLTPHSIGAMQQIFNQDPMGFLCLPCSIGILNLRGFARQIPVIVPETGVRHLLRLAMHKFYGSRLIVNDGRASDQPPAAFNLTERTDPAGQSLFGLISANNFIL